MYIYFRQRNRGYSHELIKVTFTEKYCHEKIIGLPEGVTVTQLPEGSTVNK